MLVILARHGHDISNGGSEPVLSSFGSHQIQQTCLAIQSNVASNIANIICSPAVRSIQSAQAYQRFFDTPPPIVNETLAPDGDPFFIDETVWQIAQSGIDSLLVVGHEPHLSLTAAHWAGISKNEDEDTPPTTMMQRGNAIAMVLDASTSGFILRPQSIWTNHAIPAFLTDNSVEKSGCRL